MKKQLLSSLGILLILSSCVSKKKFTEVQTELDETKSELMKTRVEKEECQEKYARIEEKVANYYSKISSLQEENDEKLEMVDGIAAMSEKSKQAMRKTLKNVDSKRLAEAKTLSDSIDLAVAYNLTKSFNKDDTEGIDINVDKTVVQITVSDKLLFKSGSSWVHPRANKLLEKIANVINSEPAMEVLVEGHTDNRTIVEDSYLEDNWDLSVRRATSIVRILQNKYNVDGKQLIAAGRSSYTPIADNSSASGREKNRRTKIIILPNLDKFLAMLEETP
ncbi:OmpA/MotB family protein [Mesonia maritima]|uniref:Chemotaxis protein MotB n=1 Tax=Mesonia maritima TaxID=1793873 RepID=A0ABU1K930_9FLAO|nr:OmpA family protein [Mesonia maritima]MDR6302107.1 chemotaxis protein MotB [Mesonia maritima]